MKYDWEHNAESWLKAMQTRKRFLRLHVGGSLLFVFLLLSFLLLANAYSDWRYAHGRPLIFWIILAGIILLGAAINFFRLRRDRFGAERVLLHKARVCPKCHAILDQENATNPEESTTLTVQCPSCSESLNLAEVEDYWAIYPGWTGVFQSWRNRLDLYSYRGKYGPNLPLALTLYLNTRTVVVLVILFLVGYPLLMSALSSGSLIASMVNHSYLLFFLPYFIFKYATSQRKGRSIHCHKCNYEKVPGTGDLCSECGEDWSWPFQCRRGQRQSSRRIKGISAALIVAGFVSPLLLQITGFRAKVMRILPTSSLITQITEHRGFVMDEWKAINQLTLVPDETRTLFLGLLEKRHDHFLFGNAENWLETQIKTGSVSQILIDRYYRESIRFESLTPTAGAPIPAPGETIHLTFEISDDFIFQWTAANHLLLEHIEINGQSVPHSRPDKPFSPHRLTGPQITKTRNYPCPIPLTLPDHPGPVTIKLIYWQIVAPMKPGIPAIQWNKDDTPILPPNTIWANRVEQEFTITLK